MNNMNNMNKATTCRPNIRNRLLTCVSLAAAPKRRRVIDDPGGNKSRLEHAFGRNISLSPEDIRTILLRKTKRVYDVELYVANGLNAANGSTASNGSNAATASTVSTASTASTASTGIWHFCILPSTHVPEKETLEYMAKLKCICESLQKWGVAHIVKDALEGLEGPVLHLIEIDLCIGSRLAEFELD
jgi:hypothetical protein